MFEFDIDEIRVTNRVTVQDRFGQFLAQVEDADRRSVEEAAKVGAAAARARAPRSMVPRHGRHMADTIHAGSATGGFSDRVIGSVSAEIIVGTEHWRFTETGTRPHEITGNVSFFWEKEGRRWNPGSNTIRHPGSIGVHFMQAGFDAAWEELPKAMKRNYAGL